MKLTEKQMRATYKLAYGREFDDAKRKQHPLPIKIAYQVALVKIEKKLEYLRGEIEAERISYGEIAELQALKDYIQPGDVQLLEWAGVPEFENTYTYHVGKNEPIEAKNVFVAIHGSEEDCNTGMIMTYAPIGQHGEASLDYVNNDTKEITADQYIKASQGLYTPDEYLMREEAK